MIEEGIDVNSGLSAVNNASRAQTAMTDNASALFGIAAARDAYDTGKDVAALVQGGSGAVKKGVGVSVNIGFSSTKSESNEERHNTTVAGSLIQSGGDTTIIARGRESEDGTGDLAIIGSEVHAGGKVILDAANDIILKSAEETHDFASSNKNDSFGVGVGINISAGKEGKDGKVGKVGISASVNANASTSQGSAEGSGTRHIETIIQGDKGVDFTSGNDTTLKGAQIIGEQITGNVGGDLAIISEQDTYNESRNQDSKGGSISIGSGLGSISGSYNQQTQKGNADYASVNEQSGIYAGDGGFDITVGDNTGLTGAVIASTAEPEDNKLTTGTLTTEDIDNSMSYDASTKGIGGEFTYVKEPGKDNKEANKGSISPGLPGKESGDDNSTTKSAVAEGTVTITDEDAQLATTGETADETIASLNRDTDNAHNGPLERPPSIEELLAQQAELTEASAVAGKAVAKTVGDICEEMYAKTKDKEWLEGGVYKTALQAAGSALVGQIGNGEGLSAGLGAIANQLISDKIKELTEIVSSSLTDDPDKRQLLNNLLTNAIAGGLGAFAGGETGANAASNMDRWNRMLHGDEVAIIKQLTRDQLEKFGVNVNDPLYKELYDEYYKRFEDAAYSLVNGHAEFTKDMTEYYEFTFKQTYAQDNYKDEIALLKSFFERDDWEDRRKDFYATYGTNPFEYSRLDERADGIVHWGNDVNLGTRALGGGQILAGFAFIAKASSEEIASLGALTPLSIAQSVYGADLIVAGVNNIFTGEFNPTRMVQELKVAGFSDVQIAAIDVVVGGTLLNPSQVIQESNRALVNSVRNFKSTVATGKIASTAQTWQWTQPRNLAESLGRRELLANPSVGQVLPLAGDTRFASNGFQKMQYVHSSPDGTKIVMHYQYNPVTEIVRDVKYTLK